MIHTTLNEIRAFNPRQTVWETLLSHLGKTQPDDEPLPLVTVLDSNGPKDTIWCLRVCPDVAAEFARWCADRAAEAAEAAEAAGWTAYWADRATHGANQAAKAAGWATDGASRATDAAKAADWAADAAYGAADAADAADWATGATGVAELQAQADKLRELLS